MTMPVPDPNNDVSGGEQVSSQPPARDFLRSLLVEQSGMSAAEADSIAASATVEDIGWAKVELLPVWRALTDTEQRLPRQAGRPEAEGHDESQDQVLHAFNAGLQDRFSPIPLIATCALRRVGEMVTSECGECEGHGKFRCDACLGDGAFSCKACSELGRLPCRRCQGGTVQCPKCAGRGEVRYRDGFIRCYKCEGGRARCRYCHGEGEVDCERCSGKGLVKCGQCSGDGTIRCRSCSGKGGFDEYTLRVLSVFAGFAVRQHFCRIGGEGKWELVDPPSNDLERRHNWLVGSPGEIQGLALPAPEMVEFAGAAMDRIQAFGRKKGILNLVLGKSSAKHGDDAKSHAGQALSEALGMPISAVVLTLGDGDDPAELRRKVLPDVIRNKANFECARFFVYLSEAHEQRITFHANGKAYVLSRWMGGRVAVETPDSFARDNLTALEQMIQKVLSEHQEERAMAVASLAQLPDDSPFKGKVVSSSLKKLSEISLAEVAERGVEASARGFGARLATLGDIAGYEVTPGSVGNIAFPGTSAGEAEKLIRKAAAGIAEPVRAKASSRSNVVLIGYILVSLVFVVLIKEGAASWLVLLCLAGLLAGPELLVDAQFKIHQAFEQTALAGWVGDSRRSHLFPRFWRTKTGIGLRLLLLVGVATWLMGGQVFAPGSRMPPSADASAEAGMGGDIPAPLGKSTATTSSSGNPAPAALSPVDRVSYAAGASFGKLLVPVSANIDVDRLAEGARAASFQSPLLLTPDQRASIERRFAQVQSGGGEGADTAGRGFALLPAVSGVESFATFREEFSYLLGLGFAESAGLSGLGIDITMFSEGVNAALGRRASRLDDAEVQQVIGGFSGRQQLDAAIAEQKAWIDAGVFLAANGREPGVTSTESGLQYRVITRGTGAMPQAGDILRLDYRGTLLDGTVFANTGAGPVDYDLADALPGWIEGLLLMPEGSTYQLWIPPHLAFGRSGDGLVPANAILVFEVTLQQIVRSASGAEQALGSAPAGYSQCTFSGAPAWAGEPPVLEHKCLDLDTPFETCTDFRWLVDGGAVISAADIGIPLRDGVLAENPAGLGFFETTNGTGVAGYWELYFAEPGGRAASESWVFLDLYGRVASNRLNPVERQAWVESKARLAGDRSGGSVIRLTRDCAEQAQATGIPATSASRKNRK